MLFGKRTGGLAASRREEFERLAERAYPSIFGSAFRLTRNREEAEDLAQESVVRAYEAFDRFDGTNFKAWILRIETNLYINRYRRKLRGPQMNSLDEENSSEPSAEETTVPERILFDEMLSQEVEEALAATPEDFRMAVILSDIEGLSYQEVADAMDVPIGTVRSRLARGRSYLRRQLRNYALKEGVIKPGVDE